jgi:hypothetical protein
MFAVIVIDLNFSRLDWLLPGCEHLNTVFALPAENLLREPYIYALRRSRYHRAAPRLGAKILCMGVGGSH